MNHIFVSTVLAGFFSSVIASPLYCPNAPLFAAGTAAVTASANRTVKNAKVQTWWHPTGEINTQTAVQNGSVRQSHLYDVQVSPVGSKNWYDSFVYETIPRNGNGQIDYPGSTTIDTSIYDGISIEPSIGVTMAWTQFLYAQDVVVRITRKNGAALSASDVIIRPTTLGYSIDSFCNSIYITVPFNVNSTKFSVEFNDDLWEYRAPLGEGYWVQNVNPSGVNYVTSYDNTSVLAVEPTNALLIFASPFPTDDLVPKRNAKTTYQVPTGLVTSLEHITAETVYFGPGVYYFGGYNFANLSSTVNWVYLAPGAYVKGAVHYSSNCPILKATGYGVLSGEQYVYQANPAINYMNTKSDATSLRLWSGVANTGQTWMLQGPTVNAPPFNTMDFNGDDEGFTTQVHDYKQVGAFWVQTDGLEVYPGSHHSDIFYHTNDDTIKTYYSNVLVERIINWKVENDPVFQMGWYSRNLTNITANDITVIHTRYISSNMVVPTALIGESPDYLDVSATNVAHRGWGVSNFAVNNLRCEGFCPALIRLNPLQNFDNFTISNVYIEKYVPSWTGISLSQILPFTYEDGAEVVFGADSPGGVGLTIRDFRVGNEVISFANDNWQADRAGELDVDASYWGQWTVEA